MEDRIKKLPVLWVLSGLDPLGASGIAVDIRLVGMLNVHVCPLVTSLTVQDLLTFDHRNVQANSLLKIQIQKLGKSVTPSGVKIGMLGSDSLIEETLEVWNHFEKAHIILDPLTHTSSGYEILTKSSRERLKKDLFPNVLLVTPNSYEAELFTGISIDSVKNMEKSADLFLGMGCPAVLIKGGHLQNIGFLSDTIMSYYSDQIRSFWIASPRRSYECRGTGCALSSIIAALMCHSHKKRLNPYEALSESVMQAYEFLDQAYSQGYFVDMGEIIDEHRPRILPSKKFSTSSKKVHRILSHCT